MKDDSAVSVYVDALRRQFDSGHAREHAYRPALKQLMDGFEDVTAINEPKRSQFGSPDFVFIKESNNDITFGYAEAKDVTIDLAKTVKTEQLRRYAGYEKLFLTNYLDFRFFRNGEQYEELSIGKIKNDQLVFNANEFARLHDVLQEFLNQPPESIRSGKRLALIMGGKARRIRDNVRIYLSHEDNEKNAELEKIFKMMKELLVHDLTPDKFADMYAQTLVYGLFAARYNDKTPETFDRKEARDLIPKSNPFLRHFFDHIVGPDFDTRLSYIVDELCEAFRVSNVYLLVQKHLRLFEVENEKDPIIHFYEDFLKEYDPDERKRMGAYYTPIPVVKFIVGQVDEILKKDFGLAKGLADTTKIEHTTTDSGGKKYKFMTHKVQILDPAVGTATFLNETIKYIYKGFEGQEGRWPAYAEQDLMPRLYGFELMMAPYTIAHLKLGMTLQETGINEFKQRLGVYLTNTLEEGVKRQQDLFTTLGLAEAVSHEADEASKIKHENPIMVIIGNPPYNNSSNNNSPWIKELIQVYKEGNRERNINSISDDYVKFIRFAEYMVSNNQEGIVAMITNNSFIDGLSHSGMRKHLLGSFSSIYIIDLHGDKRKNESSPDGGIDENVFDIMKGVSISIFVKTKKRTTAQVLHTDIYGTRKSKFSALGQFKETAWKKIEPVAPDYYFVPKNFDLEKEYDGFIKLTDLFIKFGSGIKFRKDNLLVKDFFAPSQTKKMLDDINTLEGSKIHEKYKFKDTSDWILSEKRELFHSDYESIIPIDYKPFDTRYAYYPMDRVSKLIPRGDSRVGLMSNMIKEDNVGIVIMRSQVNTRDFKAVLCTTNPIDLNYYGFQSNLFPLYLYSDDGPRVPNINPRALKKLTKDLTKDCNPQDVFDYIYAVLHSPKYREKYKEFLKIDFPRVPAPESDDQFRRFAGFGKQLRELHLLASPILNDPITTFREPGDDVVETVNYDDKKVWINDTQYFGNVPEAAWNFYVGGYQPAQKWLKDRSGRKLSNVDIEHYQKIIKAQLETVRLMQSIDEIEAA